MDAFLKELSIAAGPFLDGFLLTLVISAAAIAAGSVVGLGLGVGLTYGRRWIAWPIRAYVDIIRGTPVLVLILACYYLLAIAGVNFTAIESGLIALSAFCATHVAEMTRGALQAIPVSQIEAGRSLGLTFPRILLLILMPQALRQMLPVWVNSATEIVKASTLLSVIGVGELLLKTQETVGRNFMTLEFYALCGLLYFLINYGIERLGKRLNDRLSLPDRSAASR